MQEARKIKYLYEDTSVEDQEEIPGKRDTTKIYFFILAIAALLATNVYFYIKYQASEELAYGINTEKIYMQDEIDRIESELNRLAGENAELSQALSVSEDSVRLMIANLRTTLNQQSLTQNDLIQAQEQIDFLRGEVFQYKEHMAQLSAQNARLLEEKEVLVMESSANEQRISALAAENTDLTDQIRTASVLKLSNININGIRERRGNRESVDNRARNIDRFRIVFNLAENPLVVPGDLDVYIRVIDPNGNLRTQNNQTFELSGNPLQYTDKSSILFTNQGETYTLEWVDAAGFKKGTYTIVLYTNNSTMGHSSIVLN